MDNKQKAFGERTKAIHGGLDWTDMYPHSVNPPIYASSTFAFTSVEHGRKIFAGEDPNGYTYGRLANPTIRDTEYRIAALENAEAALLLASGMAAISTLFYTILKSGDHILADNTLYGGTLSLLTHELEKYGIEVTLVDFTDHSQIKESIQENTRMLYFEIPSNPTLKVIDIKAVVDIANSYDGHHIITAVDSTFMSPSLLKPLNLGVDFVVHSATKYLNGQSDLIAGVICGKTEGIAECRMKAVHNGGMSSPFEAFLISRGLKTLELRMKVHEENGRQVANFLNKHGMIEKVYYPGLPSHPQHQLASKQAQGYGAMIGFEIKGGFEVATKFVDSLKLITRAVSLGGVESLITHPASTTHAIVDPEDRLKAHITDTYIRLSVGIENIEDIIDDLEQALSMAEQILQDKVFAD